jgi:hypothetical protein
MAGLEYIPPYMGTVPYLDFLPGQPSPDWKEGRIFYDDENKTIAIYNDEAEIALQVGQEMYLRVKNTLPGTVTNGTLVYINGITDSLPTIDLAKSDSPYTTDVIAVATHDIESNTIGYCTTFGLVRDVDTDGIAVGTTVYVSDTEAGDFTDVVPSAPHFPIKVGVVLKESLTEGIILATIGPTDVAQTMVIQDLEINEDLRVDKKFTLNPSPITLITAVGGISITHATMRIAGDGAPVEITANPQINPSTDGAIVYLHGDDDANTVTLHDGDGLHLHSGSKLIMGQHDHLQLQFDIATGLWEEFSTNFKSFDTSWSFVSPMGDFGTYYIGGFYLFGDTSYTPAGGTSLGSANAAYGAHAFIVLGASSTDMVVRVTGTSFDETTAVRVPGDFQDIDTSGGVLNDYFETPKKWIGQVTFSLQSGTGVAINDGLCKYWDNQNSDFRITGLEVTGRAGANDSAPNFEVIRHRPIGWTFVAGNSALPPPVVADMQTDYVTEYQFKNNEEFAWKRIGLSEEINGSGSEGLVLRVTTTSNKSIETMNWTFSIRPS